MTAPLVILVGHCFADSLSLKRLIGRAFDDATIERANNDKSLEKLLAKTGERRVILLVNRALDGRFNATDGIGVIADHAQKLNAAQADVRALLISNYEDAQKAAIAAGGNPGFGKSALRSPEAVERLRAAAD